MFAISKKIGVMLIVALAYITTSVSAAIDLSGITDLINVSFDVMDIFIARGDSLIGVFVLFGVLSLVGIIITLFLGKVFAKLGNLGGNKY